MNAHQFVNGASEEEEEESFLLIYLCLFGSFLYLLWLRRDRADVGFNKFSDLRDQSCLPEVSASIGGYLHLDSQGH